MQSFILHDGRFVPDEGYDRGPMILYTEEEWRRRHDQERRHHSRFQLMVIGVSLILPIMIITSLVVLPWTRGDPIIFALLFTSLGMEGGLIIFARIIIRDIDRGPLLGLYERGFQIDHEEFYPFEEMGRIESGEKGLQIWYGNTGRWVSGRRVRTVLGEKGVKEMMMRVHGQDWAE